MGILGRHYLHTLGSNIVLKFVIGLTIGIVTARALGPEGRGEYNLMVLIITSVTTLLNFGVPASNTFFVARKRLSREQLLKASFVLSICASLVGFTLLYGAYVFGFAHVFFPVEKLSPPIIISLGIIPVVFFNLFAQAILVGENKIVLNNYITISGQGALAIVMASLYAFGMLTVWLAISLYAMSHLVVFSALMVHVRDSLPALSKSGVSLEEYLQLLKFSITVHVGNLAQFFNYRLDAFIVNFFLGAAAVGIYGIATSLGETLWLLSTSMALVLLPTLAAQQQPSKEIAIKATVATLAVSIVGGAAAVIAGPFFITLLFGKAFGGAILPFLILIPGIVVFCISNVLATYMTGIGRPGFNAGIAFISFVFTIVFDILLIPRYGIAGAAIASGISYTVSSVLTVLAFGKLSGARLNDILPIIFSIGHDIRSVVNRVKQQFA